MAKVERKDRELAARTVRISWPGDGAVAMWIERGGKHVLAPVAEDIAMARAEAEERGEARATAAVVAYLSEHREALLKHESENNEEGSTYADRELIAFFIGRFSSLEHLKPCAESQDQGAPTSPKD